MTWLTAGRAAAEDKTFQLVFCMQRHVVIGTVSVAFSSSAVFALGRSKDL